MNALLNGQSAEDGALLSQVESTIHEARDDLKSMQAEDGHWVFDLEADATIPAEFILLDHYLDEIDDVAEKKLAAYLKNIQGDHGGWGLFYGGDFNISASVKSYFALKLVGEPPNAVHMTRAREAILAVGGAANANVFTRITSPCSHKCHGAQCRSCQSRSCCCRTGFRSILVRFPIGRGPSWSHY